MSKSMEKIIIINFIAAAHKAVYKKTILKNLTEQGFKKTNINKALRELRKEGVLALYRKRWGLV